MSSLLWKIPSAIFPRLVSFASKMICNSSSVAPEVPLNILVHSRLYAINSLQWAAWWMIPTKSTGISEDWVLILLIFLLPRCLSPHYRFSKTWFPKLKALRFSRSQSSPLSLFPLLLLLPPMGLFLHLGVVVPPSLVVLVTATMEAMALDVVNVAPILLGVKSTRLKVTLLINAGVVTIMPNLRHSLLKVLPQPVLSPMARNMIGSPISEHPLT